MIPKIKFSKFDDFGPFKTKKKPLHELNWFRFVTMMQHFTKRKNTLIGWKRF
jgi:hypothetical protein